jgi:hypothetical protein
MAGRNGSNAPRIGARTGSDDAVSEVVGSILMVAITVLIAVALGFLVFSIGGPVATTHADLDVRVLNPDGVWNTGEKVSITHRGGQTLKSGDTTIIIRVGASTTVLTGGSLGSAFSDGKFNIGETWTRTMNIQGGQLVTVDVVMRTSDGTSQVLAGTKLTSGPPDPACATDTTPPYISIWTVSPSDVSYATTGAVQVIGLVTDACSAIDSSTTPNLYYRLNDGTNPAYTNEGPMTLVSQDQWQGSIPVPPGGWGTQVNKTLQFYMGPLKDSKGNTGDSVTRSDLIQSAAVTYTYVLNANPVAGTVTNLADAQSATDGGLEALVKEKATTAPTTVTRHGSSTATGGATNPSNGRGAPDDVWARLNSNNNNLRVLGFAAGTGTIQSVRIGYEGHYRYESSSVSVNDEFKLYYKISGSTGSTSSAFIPNLSTDAQRFLDITSDRASWSWTDILNLEIWGEYAKVGAEDSIDFYIDSMWLETTSATTTYSTNVELNITGVPSGNPYTLELLYRTKFDTFRVEVFDPNTATWNTRGSTLTQTVATSWSYQLTVNEYAAGSPRIRIIDQTPAGTSQGEVYFDYVRVRTN